MTPTITRTGFPAPEFTRADTPVVPDATTLARNEVWTQWVKDSLISLGIITTVVGIVTHLPGGLSNAMSAAALALVGFCVARVRGLALGVFALAITIVSSLYFDAFGTLASAAKAAVFAESFLIGLCGSAAGSWIRDQQLQLVRFRREKDDWQETVNALEKRQRLFLRDVLSAVTSHRLHLCETTSELPPLVSSTMPIAPILLTAATLRDLRDAVRDAGAHAAISENAIGELVMAVSEAAMNTVVHARNGVAEVHVDRESKRIQVKIQDQGDGIDERLLHRATLEAGFSSKGSLGQGFSLMVSCCRKVHLLTNPSGTTVVLEANVM